MKRYLLLIAVSLCVYAGSAGNGRAAPALAAGKEHARTIRDFDIDAVVDAVTSAMAEAARNYYLPDKSVNSKLITRYRKDAKTIISHDSTFRRSLGEICIGLANTAAYAVDQEGESLPGKPLTLPVKETHYDEGVSSITVTEGETTVVFTNTMPCINAAGRALNGGVREQYLPGAPEGSPARENYGTGAATIMSTNRLFNHSLAEVCAKLVRAAKMEAEARK